MDKRIIFIVIVGFVIIKGLVMFITFESYTASAATIYVGSGLGNHTNSIQDAIDNFANDGDTVYVYSGTYSENVMVNKTLTLIGEAKEDTIIDGGGSENVVTIYQVPFVNISGFTITNSGSGLRDCGLSITILSHYCNISDNRFLNNLCGIRLSCSWGNTIWNNNVSSNSEHGLDLYNSSRNTIKDNHILSNNESGIHLSDSNENLINGNAITNNNHSGLSLIYSSNNNISGNEISGNYHGIEINITSNYNTIIKNNVHSNNGNGVCCMFSSDDNLIKANDITNNGNGIVIFSSSDNYIYHNNIVDNVIQALDNTNASNYWDNSYPSGGNYWSDYIGLDLNSTPTQSVPPPDGIGDTSYLIDSNSRDNYPFMEFIQRLQPPLQPPTLYINISQNGKDVILSWDPQLVQDFDPYLIYRSTDPTNFDFGTPWVNTLIDKEPGEPEPIPDRTMWNDTNAAFPGNLTNYKEQYYYVIRAFNGRGEISSTSRTVGKWTKIFPKGISTFSLPLEPIIPLDINYYTSEMKADYVKFINVTTHKWMRHNLGEGDINNTQIKPGEGYEVKFNNQTNFTFTGLPGAMISYDNDTGFLGFDHATAKNLTATIESNGDVNLTWQDPSSMGKGGWYEVYYSNSRDGFLGTPGIHYEPACPAIPFGTNTITTTGLRADNSGARSYFMVVPFNASGIRGASTYSIGIWTEEFLPQYDTFGIPLQLSARQTADWYCDNIPNAVGINYYNTSEQRWFWHSRRMPAEAYDPILEMTEGYQISTLNATKFIFIGV